MLNAHFDRRVDGGKVVFLTPLPEGRVVVVHGYARRRDEEERGTSRVCFLEGGGVVKIGGAEVDMLVVEIFELGGGRI